MGKKNSRMTWIITMIICNLVCMVGFQVLKKAAWLNIKMDMIALSAVSITFVVFGIIESAREKRDNIKNKEIHNIISAYLAERYNIAQNIEWEMWRKRRVNTYNLTFCGYVYALAFSGSLSVIYDISYIMIVLALIIFCLELYIKILLSRYINDICVKEQKPAAAVKCWYQIFHKEIIILQKWAGIDMNMAVYMCNDYAYEYALRLVDQIWENNLNINKKGNYRMQYMFVKYRCLRGLGQDASTYLQSMQAEIEKNPNNTLNKKIKMKLETEVYDMEEV